MSWTARPTLAPGEYPRGDQVEAILDQIDSLTDSGWTTYAPLSSVFWTASVSNPVLNNGTFAARYRRPVDSDLVVFEFNITMGSSTTYGSGFWIISLPLTAHASSLLLGYGRMLDSGTIERPLTCRKHTTSSVVLISDGGAVTPTTPITWATSDVVEVQVQYEPA